MAAGGSPRPLVRYTAYEASQQKNKKTLRTMQNSNPAGDTPPHESTVTDSEAWGMWEAGLVLGSIGVGAIGLIVIGWAVERFLLS